MAALLERIVRFCTLKPWLVVGLTLVLTLAAGVFSVQRFAIDTNTAKLISPDIPWRQDEIAYGKAFPQFDNLIAAVIDGPTPEAVDSAADRLVAALGQADMRADVVRAWRPDRNAYLDREGLLLTDRPTLETTLADLVARRDFLGGLAADPSLRGLMRLISGAMEAAEKDRARFDPFLAPLDRIATTIESALAGQPKPLSWRALLDRGEPTAGELRRIVLIDPVLDFTALEPGGKPTKAVRATAAKLGIDKAGGYVFRLTGPTPLADEEFGTVAENYEINLGVTIALVALVLFLALRSGKIIFAVLVTLFVGLVITMGVGLIAVQRLNLISVAFAALFIGLGVDFGIQFATRYREERRNHDDLKQALTAAIRNIGYSLSLAAMSLVAGFFCFLPTEFKGVSELGLIAGLGMIVAFATTIVFLPALMVVIRPGPETRPVETASLAAVDRWIEHHRAIVLIATALVVLAGVPALLKLKFDSNPMHLRSDKVESVATFYDLAHDPQTAPNTISILAADLKEADALAVRLASLPTVARVVTLSTFLPQDQKEKLAMVAKARAELAGVLDARPEDSEVGAFISPRSIKLAKARSKQKGILTGQDLSRTFAWLRPNDLIWNYVVNNYLLGNDPPPFDILYWNNDSTNLPMQLHHDYLDMYESEPMRKPGTVPFMGHKIDLRKITQDVFFLAGVTDHITPWKAVYRSMKLLGSENKTFILSSSGHIQSLINPPGNPKARFFTNPSLPDDVEQFPNGASQTAASWWDTWAGWLFVGFVAGAARQVAGTGVTINNLLPGLFYTDATRNSLNVRASEQGTSFEVEAAALAKRFRVPARRFGDAEDAGRLVAVLCSAFAGYVVGQNWVVDGGITNVTF